MNTIKTAQTFNIESIKKKEYSLLLCSDEYLWDKIGKLKKDTNLRFLIIGSILYNLRKRYAAHRKGSFEKIYKEKGFKKNEVQTLLSKYILYKEKSNSIVCNANNKKEVLKIIERIEDSSQRTIGYLKKLPAKDKERFLSGELSAYGVKIIAEELKSKKEPKKTLPFYKSLNNFRKKILKINPSEVPQILDEIKDVEKFILEIQKELQAKIEK